MSTNYETKDGNVKISEDVISSIAAISAKECDGVSALAQKATSDIKGMISGKKSFVKGVRAEIFENDVEIEIGIVVKFGAKLQEVALKVQSEVKREVMAMTGMTVRTVNVYVMGIANVKEKKVADTVVKEL